MNKIWLVIIIVSLAFGLFSGNITSLNQVILGIGEETFNFVVPTLASICFFNGIMKIAEHAGVLAWLQRLLYPLFLRLFPDLKQDHETLGYILTNVVINMVGLGSAATPSGLKAMECMQKKNPNPSVATRSMVTFLILNTAGVTLFATNIIAMRFQFDSTNPTLFLPIAVFATIVTSIVALVIDRVVNYRD